MKRVFNIQVQRADNGFIAIAQSDVPGVKSRKVVAVDEQDITAKVKNIVDHMFDAPPAKEGNPAPVPAPTPTPA